MVSHKRFNEIKNILTNVLEDKEILDETLLLIGEVLRYDPEKKTYSTEYYEKYQKKYREKEEVKENLRLKKARERKKDCKTT